MYLACLVLLSVVAVIAIVAVLIFARLTYPEMRTEMGRLAMWGWAFCSIGAFVPIYIWQYMLREREGWDLAFTILSIVVYAVAVWKLFPGRREDTPPDVSHDSANYWHHIGSRERQLPPPANMAN